MLDHTDRIRRAYAPTSLDDAHVDDVWDAARNHVAASSARARRPRRRPVAVLIFAAIIVSISSVAIAKPGTISKLVGRDSDRPADRMSVLRDSDPVPVAEFDEFTRHMLRGAGATGDSFDLDDVHESLVFSDEMVSIRMYSAPSSKGNVCLITRIRFTAPQKNEAGIGGCGNGMRYNGHVAVGAMSDIRHGTVVIGQADDAVTRVRVRLSDGTLATAELDKNSFAAHIANPKLRTRGLLVDLDDGRTIDVTMSGCLRSQVVPKRKSNLGCGFGMNKGPAVPPR